jgi:hypothetical protein
MLSSRACFGPDQAIQQPTRATFKMVLMNELEAPGGRVSLPEHNLRITRIIRAELEGYDRGAAEVESVLREMK